MDSAFSPFNMSVKFGEDATDKEGAQTFALMDDDAPPSKKEKYYRPRCPRDGWGSGFSGRLRHAACPGRV